MLRGRREQLQRDTPSRSRPHPARPSCIPQLWQTDSQGGRRRNTGRLGNTDGQRRNVSRRRRSSNALADDTERPRTEKSHLGKWGTGTSAFGGAAGTEAQNGLRGVSSAVRKQPFFLCGFINTWAIRLPTLRAVTGDNDKQQLALP